jgi:hypothetical protein
MFFCSGLGLVSHLAEVGRVATHEVAEVFGKAAVGAFDFLLSQVVQFGGDSKTDEGVGVVFVVAHLCSLYFQSEHTLQSEIFNRVGEHLIFLNISLDTRMNKGAAGENIFRAHLRLVKKNCFVSAHVKSFLTI